MVKSDNVYNSTLEQVYLSKCTTRHFQEQYHCGFTYSSALHTLLCRNVRTSLYACAILWSHAHALPQLRKVVLNANESCGSPFLLGLQAASLLTSFSLTFATSIDYKPAAPA